MKNSPISLGSKISVSGEIVNEPLIVFDAGLDDTHRLFDCSSGRGVEEDVAFIDREPGDSVSSDSADAVVLVGVEGSDVVVSVGGDEDLTISLES